MFGKGLSNKQPMHSLLSFVTLNLDFVMRTKVFLHNLITDFKQTSLVLYSVEI